MSPYRKPGERVVYVEAPPPKKDARPEWRAQHPIMRLALWAWWTFSALLLGYGLRGGEPWTVACASIGWLLTSNIIFRSYR